MDIGYSNADNVTAYDDGTDSTADAYVWGALVGTGTDMQSYISTTTASVTRNADDLRYTAAGNASQGGTTVSTALCPPFNSGTDVLVSIGSGSTNRWDLRIDGTVDRPGSFSSVASVTQWSITSGSGDVSDGEKHEARVTYATDDVELFYDGVSVGTDVSATLLDPSGSTISIGESSLNGANARCLIGRTRIWSQKVRP